MPLTDKKRRYAAARLAGKGIKAAAIEAGCPEKTAAQAGSRYEKDADVIAHMGRLRAAGAEDSGAESVNPPAPKSRQASPYPPGNRPQAEKSGIEGDEPPQNGDKAHDSDDFEGESLIGAMLRRGFKDPLDFFEAMVNDIAEEPKLRLEAAKAWAAYKHAKPGVGGKKGERQAAAQQVAKGRFGAQPPPLKRVK